MLVRTAAVLAAVTLGGAIALSSLFACGTSPVGVEACQKIEKTRCESAPGCGIDLGHPVHNGDTPEKAVASCIRYYDDQCLHGLVTTQEPATQDVDACVSAIITGSCDVVKTPESVKACAFLVPPATAPAPAVDAAATTDTGVGFGALGDAAEGG